MAKIDTSTIEGYESMTAEEKVATLEAATLPDPDYTGYVKKDQFDKVASDLAASKKKLKEQLSEEDRKKAEDAEEVQNLRNQVAELTKASTIAQYKANFIAQGYAEDLAADTAEAMYSGDTAKVFANNKTFLEEYAKTVRAEQMKGTPRPPAGSAGGVDYQKLIDEAMASGNHAAAAYYTRLKEQSKK